MLFPWLEVKLPNWDVGSWLHLRIDPVISEVRLLTNQVKVLASVKAGCKDLSVLENFILSIRRVNQLEQISSYVKLLYNSRRRSAGTVVTEALHNIISRK